jgi:hypothetical protein
MGVIDLVTALQTRGCPVCGYLGHVAFEFFCHFQFDLVTQERAQQQFAEQRGFCPLHTWQLAAIMSPQDLSIALSALVERTSADAGNQAAGPRPGSDQLAAWFVNAEQCQACGVLRKAEADFTAGLAKFVAQQDGQKEYAGSQGVCLRHLDGLLAAAPTDLVRQFLLGEAARRFAELARDMRAYTLKCEALRRAFATDDEKDAYHRALVHLVGAKWVSLPWTEEQA